MRERAKDLPLECESFYLPGFLTDDESQALFAELCDNYDLQPGTITLADGTEWQQTCGKLMFVEPRLIDPTLFPLAHGRRVAWPKTVEAVMERAAAITGTTYQVCVGIYYPDGKSGVDFHADPPAFGDTSSIASISLGAQRRLTLREQADHAKSIDILLERGSLLFMGERFQDRYEHALLADDHCTRPRLNLTFRRFGWDSP